MPGTLFVVATPIGNLEDLTFRALRTLREVDLIAAEDTRRTLKLLTHYGVRKPLVSLREHNEMREGPRLVARMSAGESIALVSDAGTPGISDPGAGLVAMARQGGVTVVPIPGCSAATTALSVSGLPPGQVVFAGFPPPSGAARSRWFRDLSYDQRAAVLFESPHRIESTLQILSGFLLNRTIWVFRELTKINESFVKYTKHGDIDISKGEFTVVVGPGAAGTPDESLSDDEILRLFVYLTNDETIDSSAAIDIIARMKPAEADAQARNRVKRIAYSAKRPKIGPA